METNCFGLKYLLILDTGHLLQQLFVIHSKELPMQCQDLQ